MEELPVPVSPIVPPGLCPGDTVAVVAPAGAVNEADLREGIALLTRRYKVVWDEEILGADGYLAGGDERRRRELQRALDDGEIKAVIAARGGFGTTRILDDLELEALVRSPKWIVGSSDLTAALVQLWDKYHLMTVHGPMVAGFKSAREEDREVLFGLLEGGGSARSVPLEPILAGQAKGSLVGGNLTVLAHLVGATSPAVARGAILFLEDVTERPYRIDRCLTQLRRAGFLTGIRGIILGDFTDCAPGPDGTSVGDVVMRNLSPLGVPVARGYPAAHGLRNAPFIHGGEVRLEVGEDEAAVWLQG